MRGEGLRRTGRAGAALFRHQILIEVASLSAAVRKVVLPLVRIRAGGPAHRFGRRLPEHVDVPVRRLACELEMLVEILAIEPLKAFGGGELDWPFRYHDHMHVAQERLGWQMVIFVDRASPMMPRAVTMGGPEAKTGRERTHEVEHKHMVRFPFEARKRMCAIFQACQIAAENRVLALAP